MYNKICKKLYLESRVYIVDCTLANTGCSHNIDRNPIMKKRRL